MRKLTRPYTSEQLRRGEDMTYHPVTGHTLNPKAFNEKHQRFMAFSPFAWCAYDVPEPLPDISDDKDHAYNDDYPSHWRFDPSTGLPLRPLSGGNAAWLLW